MRIPILSPPLVFEQDLPNDPMEEGSYKTFFNDFIDLLLRFVCSELVRRES
jgi:hypothetical protein